jgi:hypothetical protein|tara:strand:- start:339 stop:731 length:393 start_codon:yes stop_codon:yes gene_type:complete
MPENFVFLDAQGATGAGTALNVSKFRYIVVEVATDGGGTADLTLQCQGALGTTAPTWTAAQALDNMWDYIALADYNDATFEVGDTGFVVAAADDYRIFEVNVNGLEWVNFRVTAWAAGSVTVRGKAFSNL